MSLYRKKRDHIFVNIIRLKDSTSLNEGIRKHLDAEESTSKVKYQLFRKSEVKQETICSHHKMTHHSKLQG